MLPGSMQPNGATTVNQNVQLWAPGPGGSISVSGVCPPHSNANIVTLPSGQTVLMANLPTTANSLTVPISVSSPLGKPQISCPQVLPTGSQIVLSNNGTPLTGSIPTQLNPSTVIQGPNGPIPVALPSGILSNTPMNSLGAAQTAFMSSAPGNAIADSSQQMAQFVDQATRTGQTSFTVNTGFQNIVSANQIVVDPSGMKFTTMQPPANHLGTNAIRQQLISVSQPTLPSSSSSNDCADGQGSSNFPVSVAIRPNLVVSKTSTTTSLLNSSNPQTTLTDHSTLQMSVPSTNGIAQSNVESTEEIKSDGLESQTPDSRGQTVEQSVSVFTPKSLNDLLSEIDPQLQLDLESGDVLKNLANEFILSVTEKAAKLATHRGSSVVDAKDIHFCLERDWDISVPGYSSEDRLMRKPVIVEAHKQRLALIKKQIKKM